MKLSKILPLQAKHYLAPVTLIFLATIATLLELNFTQKLIYLRSLVNQGEVWRIISAHFLHTNTAHFLLNIAAVIMLWLLHGRFYTIKSYITVFIVSALISMIGIHWFSPDFDSYVGLSGVLHGMCVWGAIQEIKNKEASGYLLLAAVALKIIYEQFMGASHELSTLINAHVAINAHLWGALGGLSAALISLKKGVTHDE